MLCDFRLTGFPASPIKFQTWALAVNVTDTIRMIAIKTGNIIFFIFISFPSIERENKPSTFEL
jgi:hypothetical protein